MPSLRIDTEATPWTSGRPIYGDAAVHDGRAIVELKMLSDRRPAGGGVAFLVRFAPPPGKLIKVVAVARSDEHVFALAGGRGTKSGAVVQGQGGYTLNPAGQAHSAFIAEETVSLVVYSGEPDEVLALEVIDLAPRHAS